MDEPSLPPLNWLRVFEAAARHLSFASAARELGMTGPAVSQQIKALETFLKQDLFRRGAHDVRLTQSGQNYLPFVQYALSTVATGTRSIFGPRAGQQLIVHSSLAFALIWLPPRVGTFLKRHSRLSLQIGSSSMINRFEPGLAEIQVVYGPGHAAGQNRDLIFGEYFCAFAKPHIAKEIKKPSDILDHTLIEPIGHHVDWIRFLREAGTVGRPKRRLRVDNSEIALKLAAESQGIALLMMPLVQNACRSLGLKRVLPNHSIVGPNEFSIAYPPEPMLSENGRAFRNWVLSDSSQFRK